MIANYLEQFRRTDTHFGEAPRPATLNIHQMHLTRFEKQYSGGSVVSNAKSYVLGLKEAGVGPSTVNHALTALDGYIEYLSDNEEISEANLKSWRTFKRKTHQTWRRRDRHRKYLSEAATSDLLRAVTTTAQSTAQANRDIAIMGLILFGPCRGGEVLKLLLSDVIFFDATHSIPAHWCFHFRAEITKDHEAKDVRIFAGTTAVGDVDIFDHFTAYLRWRREQSNDGALFVRTRRPFSDDAVSRQNLIVGFRRYCAAAGVHATPHWLRHTFGEATAGRLDSRSIRQMYGHSSEQTTQGYTDHDNDDRMIEAQLQAARIISRADAQ